MKSDEGRRLHGLAAQAREDGESLKALQLTDEAMLAYQKDGDLLGLAEVFADRAITLRHLHQNTGDKSFLHIAKAETQASVDIAKDSGDKSALAIPYFNLAKIQQELGEINEAVMNFKEAVDNIEENPPIAHGKRPAIVADFKNHLAVAEYLLGDKSALERAELAVQDLEAADEEKYNKDVWLSGAHMRITDILRTDEPEKAKEHLQKAKEIIDANPDLKIRKQQWEKLSASF